MASGFSTYYADKINNAIFHKTDFVSSLPTSYWVALFNNGGSGAQLRADNISGANEVAGNNYGRIEVRGATGIDWTTSSGGLIVTDTGDDITFAAASGNWGTIYAVALMDAASNGHVVLYGELAVPKTVSSPDVFKIPASYFQVQL